MNLCRTLPIMGGACLQPQARINDPLPLPGALARQPIDSNPKHFNPERTALNTALPETRDRLTVDALTLQTLGTFVHLFDAYRQFYGQAPNLSACRHYLEARLIAGESQLWGASVNGHPGALAQVYPTWSSLRMGRVWVLNDLFVHPEWRRRGLAEALLQTIEDAARQSVVVSLTLETQRSNTAALALYQRMGWTQENEFHTLSRDIT